MESWKAGRKKGDNTLPTNLCLTEMTFRKMVPMLKGLNTHAFALNIPSFIQANQKVLHLEIGRAHDKLIKTLVKYGKQLSIFERFWGKHVHPTETLDARATRKELTALGDIMHNHTSYICSARSDSLLGITCLDKQVEIKENGTVVNSFISARSYSCR